MCIKEWTPTGGRLEEDADTVNVICKLEEREKRNVTLDELSSFVEEQAIADGVRPNNLSGQGNSLMCLGDIHHDVEPFKAADSSWGTKPWLKADMCQDLPFKPA